MQQYLQNKKGLVENVFNKVFDKYDIMNDFMSFGIHRAWKKNLIKSDIDSIETSAQIKIFNNGLLPLDQSILSSRFLCLTDALNGPRKKNMPNELIAKSPKKIVLKSTIYFLILPRVLAFLSRAKSK